jgi:hypothetical protein
MRCSARCLLYMTTKEETTVKAAKMRRLPQSIEYDLPNVPRYGGANAVATSATAAGVEVMVGLRSVLLTVEDTRRLADYLMEAADIVELGQARTRQERPPTWD